MRRDHRTRLEPEPPSLGGTPAARAAWLKMRGLWECPECKTWAFDSDESRSFHYRRCEA